MSTSRFHADCHIPADAVIDPSATLGPRVVLAGEHIVIGKGASLEAACIIGTGVHIGQGACVRAGAVVLRSVPPNAIVEGNPAHVVGYRNDPRQSLRPEPRLFDISQHHDLKRPARIPLGVGESALYLLRSVTDVRGSLTVGEVPAELPFTPSRFFAVFDVPSMELRGEHAHRQCHQFLMCLHGSCRVLLDDGQQRCEVTLDRPDMGVFMPAMIWGTQYRYTADAVLLVFASHHYDSSDYIRTYDQFMAEVQR